MNILIKHTTSDQLAGPSLKECWWMQAGVVQYKLCDRDYDCEHCLFDEVLQGRIPNYPGVTAVESSQRSAELDTKKGCRDVRVHGCEVPGGLFYHPAHTWARIEEGGCVRTGLDDFAQRILGRPYFISMVPPGTKVSLGKVCSLITHQDGIAGLVAPVSGKVREINHALYQQPALLNREPYGAGWMLQIEPIDLKGCLNQLLYGPKAVEWSEREFVKLHEKVSQLLISKADSTGPTMNDGGWLSEDFMNALTADQVRQLIHSLFPLSPTEHAELNKAILNR